MPLSNLPDHIPHNLRRRFVGALRAHDVKVVLDCLDQHPILARADLSSVHVPKDASEPRWSALMTAAEEAYLPMVKALVPRIDPTLVDEDGQDALMIAIQKKAQNVALVLVPVSDPLHVSAEGNDALMMAAHQGLRSVVKALVPISDVTRCNPNGQHALILAALNDPDLVGVLLKTTVARIPVEDKKAWHDLLMGAASAGNTRILEACLPHVNLKGAQGRAALFKAVHDCQPSVVKVLLQHKVQVQHKKVQKNPLIEALGHDDMPLMSMLLDALPTTARPFEAPLRILDAAWQSDRSNLFLGLAKRAPLHVLSTAWAWYETHEHTSRRWIEHREAFRNVFTQREGDLLHSSIEPDSDDSKHVRDLPKVRPRI